MLSLVNWGIDWIVALQQLTWLAAGMRAVTWLGSEEFFLLVMPALYWCVSRRLGLGMAVMLIASNAANSLVKLALHMPRPYWVDTRVQALSSETSYGLPSGHAQNAAAIWGYLASQVRRVPSAAAWALALTLIGLISVSRPYLGVHFPMDVLGGWLLGGLLLWAMLRWQAPAEAWLARIGLGRQVLAAVVVSVVYLALGVAVLGALGAVTDPPEWQVNATLAQGEPIAPRDSESVANNAGLLLGLGLGMALARRYAQFRASGPWTQRAGRFVLGVIGILICWRGLALVFPSQPEAVDFAFRYVRYALTALWALFGAPWVFLRLGLASADERQHALA